MSDEQLKIKPMSEAEIKREINLMVLATRYCPLTKKYQRRGAALVHAFCKVLGYKNLPHYETHNPIKVDITIQEAVTELLHKYGD